MKPRNLLRNLKQKVARTRCQALLFDIPSKKPEDQKANAGISRIAHHNHTRDHSRHLKIPATIKSRKEHYRIKFQQNSDTKKEPRQYRLPSISLNRYFVESGGLASYGNDPLDASRGAASYVDRILRGAKPADLPVQLPIKFEMAINAKTAKALGIEVPPSLLAIADEVIE